VNNIHPNAKIGANVSIGAFVTIEEDVEIGEGTVIGPNAVILNGTRMGTNCQVFSGAIVGSIPQDLKFEGEESLLEIGNNVIIREYCTLNRGTKANYKTQIGNNCLLMAYVHVAHDCIIGDNAILANSVNLAGHIEIGKNVILGGLTAIHQFVKIGDYSMVGGGSLVRKDVPPFIKAAREPICYVGVNSIGLRRRGFSNKQINHILDIYKILFVRGYPRTKAITIIETTIQATPEREMILDFVTRSDRGIIKGFRAM
jgi:UDP-N-acetylglucosamine acyltransferase